MLSRRSRYLLAATALAVALALSRADRLYMLGDDVNKLSVGRGLPLPEYGNYIAARVVDNYFIGHLFGVFRTFVAPWFGLSHVVDAHSVFATLFYAVAGTWLLALVFAFARLAVELRPRHFLPFALCAYVLVLHRMELDAVTGIGAFMLPAALSLTLLWPVLRYTVLGVDTFVGRAPATGTAVMGTLAYLVAFSVPSISTFTAFVLAGALVAGLVVGDGGTWRERSRPRALRATFRGWPDWLRVTALVVPVLVGVAAFYDLTSGRYHDEAQRTFRLEGFSELSLVAGVRSLPWSGGAAVDGFIALGLLSAALTLREAYRRAPALVRRRAAALTLALVPAYFGYFVFLQRISNLGGKNYFEHPGMNFCITVALAVPALIGTFALLRRARLGALLAFSIGLLCVHALRLMSEVPTRPVSKAEVRGIFDSMYMCHAYGESRVPVFLRDVEVGWPYGAAEEGWYLDAYRRAFQEHVIGRGATLLPGFAPQFHRVPTVEALHAELARMAASRPCLVLELESSPYCIDFRANSDVRGGRP